MKSFDYTIKDAVGIHIRPAGKLSQLAKEFDGTKIMIEANGKRVDVTRLMMLMGLGVKCGDTVSFTIEGADEEAAAAAVEEFMIANL